MKLKWITIGIILAGALSSQAAPILWDLNLDGNPSGQGTVANYTAMGVTEDLTGAVVSQVLASPTDSMTNGTVVLSYLGGNAADGVADGASLTGVLYDYLYIANGLNGGPVDMRISGLSSLLSANTTYSFYLIGSGNATNQGAQFTFNSVSKTTISETTAPDAAAKFSFATGSSVSDTLDFTWSRVGTAEYSGFNGFAIVAVPEPATIGLVGIFGALLIVFRRSLFRKMKLRWSPSTNFKIGG